ncbi:MAG: FAD-dependent oxidoreductase [Candidatus Margulisiibacteriota bacterium]|nr:MAG: FAD-dependent oxidoreductase [Candidatus Margulisiibacteriota bacterium]HCY36535.1 FAD-dependent oxidoreductase [Candidatus Margulisiibacteriota bacterium]
MNYDKYSATKSSESKKGGINVSAHIYKGIPGKPESFWIATTPETNFPNLKKAMTVDVAVIGGGITGITSALLLKKAGLSVAVIESDRIIKGVTGNTTAKITSQHSLTYAYLIAKFGEVLARQYADANQAGIEKIASLAEEHHIDCEFIRQPAYTYTLPGGKRDQVIEEVAAAKKLGLPATFVESIPLPFKVDGAIRFDNQAQFHPRKYLLSLAKIIDGNGSYIFEKTRAVDVKEGTPCTVITDKGEFKAKNVIIATNYPFNDKYGLYNARLFPSQSYALGLKIEETFPEGMYISTGNPVYSLRSHPVETGQLVIAVGENHRTGQGGNTIIHYKKLEEATKKLFKVTSVEYRWTTEDYISVDLVPYIGKLTQDSSHLYVATGFKKWGMTHGTVAGMILTDLIQGKQNPWSQVFDPGRFDIEQAKKENIFAVGLASETPPSPPAGDPLQLGLGEGALLQAKDHKVAAYKDPDGNIYTLSGNCTHMGCTVTWNEAESTWDCQCHGSRFNYKGCVIHDPAVTDLGEINLE